MFLPIIPMGYEDIMTDVGDKANEGSAFDTNRRKNQFENWIRAWKSGDLTQIFNPSTSAVESNEDKPWWQQLIDAFTGTANTDRANAATAALQEDAQQFNSEEAEKQRSWEAQQAVIARLWQEQMSNTAVQRQSADLKAAGFNPWLATNGAGASTGSVGIASGDSASSAQGQGINAAKSGAEVLAAVGITAASIAKILKILK